MQTNLGINLYIYKKEKKQKQIEEYEKKLFIFRNSDQYVCD